MFLTVSTLLNFPIFFIIDALSRQLQGWRPFDLATMNENNHFRDLTGLQHWQTLTTVIVSTHLRLLLQAENGIMWLWENSTIFLPRNYISFFWPIFILAFHTPKYLNIFRASLSQIILTGNAILETIDPNLADTIRSELPVHQAGFQSSYSITDQLLGLPWLETNH